ncbi:MAG: CARDB domain-containing protein, partial [Bacteroidota bacterium]
VGEGGSEAQANVAVTGVNVVSRIVEAGQPVRLEATLQNFGTRNLEGYVVSVFFEGNRVAQNAVDLSAGGTATVDFTATPQRRGWLAGEVRGEDDAFEADNVRHFTLNVPERRRILVVRGDGQRTDFIELALSPELTRGRVAFDATTVSEAQLPATNLGRFDAVVLVGLRTVSSGEASALRGFVESGGGVLVFPSAEAATGAYDALMPALGGGAFAGLTGQIGAAEPATSFGRVDREHPLFDGVFDGGPGRQVESPDFYAVADYTPGRGDEQTLIQLSTGRPFLQEVRQGEGVSLVLAVPPERAWSDLPVRGLFVPLLYRSLFYLSASDGAGTGDAVLGEPASVRVAGAGPFVLAGPNGAEYAPEQRSVYGATLVELPAAAQEAGVYDLRTATGETVRRVALNLPPDESDLRRLSTSDAASRLEAATGRPVTIAEAGGDGSVLANTVREARYGTELWNVFLALALAFLVAEMLVSKQWRPESELATA